MVETEAPAFAENEFPRVSLPLEKVEICTTQTSLLK
jgi:hypothetical protein